MTEYNTLMKLWEFVLRAVTKGSERVSIFAPYAFALFLALVWLFAYWIIILPKADEILVVCDCYIYFDSDKIKQLSLTKYFLGSAKNLAAFTFFVSFDAAILLWFKREIPLKRLAFGSFVVTGLIFILLIAIRSGDKPGSIELALLNALFASSVLVKFCSYIYPREPAKIMGEP